MVVVVPSPRLSGRRRQELASEHLTDR
jgi:hypothetical protein